MRLASSVVAALLAIAPVAPTQSTWIVDANNGPGTNFLDLPAAVAQVAADDVLLVRAGLYTGFTTSKPLRIVGLGGVVVRRFSLSPPLPPVVEVRNLPAGTTLTLKNLRIEPHQLNGSAVVLANNVGSVHCEDVHANGLAAAYGASGLLAVQCGSVTVTGGTLDGWPAVNVSRSLLALAGVSVIGGDASWSPRNPQLSSTGIFASEATVLLSRTDVRGGGGSVIFEYQTSAVTATRTELTVTGDAATSVRAGASWSGATPTAGIQTDGGTVTADPLITIAGSDGGPAVGGTASVRLQRVASLLASGAPLGGTAQVELVSPANEPIAIALAFPAAPLPLLGGWWFLDLGSLLPVVVGTQNATGRTAVSFVVPVLADLRGRAVALQAVHFHLARNFLELSNPAVIVID